MMFTKSELDLFKNPQWKKEKNFQTAIKSPDFEKWLSVFFRWDDHVEACAKLGIIGVGCYRHYQE